MLTIKINWGNNSNSLPLYSVYTAEKYGVDDLGEADNTKPRHDDFCNVWKNCQQCDGPDLSRSCTCCGVRLLLDDGKHDILLSKGSRTYVMNSHGATVDTIVVN